MNIDTERLEIDRLEGVFAEHPAKHIFAQLDDQRKAAVIGVLTKKDRSPQALAAFRDFAAAAKKNSDLRSTFHAAYKADVEKKRETARQLTAAYGPPPTDEDIAAAGGAVPTVMRAARYLAAGVLETLPLSATAAAHGAFAPPEELIAEVWRGSPRDPGRVAFEQKSIPVGIGWSGKNINVSVADATTLAGNVAPAIIGSLASLVRGGIRFATGKAAETASKSLLAGGFKWTDRLVGGGALGSGAEKLLLANRWAKAGEAARLAGKGPKFLSTTVTPRFAGYFANLAGRGAQVSTSELGRNFPQTINDQFGEVVVPENFFGAMMTDMGLGAVMGGVFGAPGLLLSHARNKRLLRLKGASDALLADLEADTLAKVGVTPNQADDLLRAHDQALAINADLPEGVVTPGLLGRELDAAINAPPRNLPQPTDAPSPTSAYGAEIDAEIKAAAEAEARGFVLDDDPAATARATAEGRVRDATDQYPITPGLLDEKLGRTAEPAAKKTAPDVSPPKPSSGYGAEMDAEIRAEMASAEERGASTSAMVDEIPVESNEGLRLVEVTRPELAAQAAAYRSQQALRRVETDTTTRVPQRLLTGRVEAAQQQPGILLRAETPPASTAPVSGTFAGQQPGTNLGFVRVGTRNVSVPMDALPAGVKKGALVEVAADALNAESMRGVKTSTKVADSQGQPITVYHGTHSDFTSFKVGTDGQIWFAENPQKASNYTVPRLTGGNVRTARLDITNPLVYGSPESKQAVKEGWFGDVKEMRARGYDGTQKGPLGSRVWSVFSPDQVKSPPPLPRADSATRRAIDRGETSVALAKADPRAASAEAITNQRTRVLALTDDADLQTYIRSVTDQPISPAAARDWALNGTGDLDSWARRGGPANNALGALAVGPASLIGDDDEPDRLRAVLGGTAALMVVGAVLSRGKAPKSLFKAEIGAARALRAAETRYASALRMLERAPSNPAFARSVEQAAKALAAAKAAKEGAQIAGAELAEMVGKPGVPTDLVLRMDDAAQRQHLLARRNAATTVHGLAGFLEKYHQVIRRHGSDFNNALLDGIALKAAALGVDTPLMGALVKRSMEGRTKRASLTTDAAVADMNDTLTGIYGAAGRVLLGSDKAGVADEGTWEAIKLIMENAGVINHQGGDMPMPLRSWFMDARNVAAFDPELHAVMTYATIREVIEKRIVYEHAKLGEEIFHGLSDGQLAAIPYIMQGKVVPKDVPFGQRAVRVRRYADVVKERGGNQILKAGEELYKHGEKEGAEEFVIFNPNKRVAAIDDEAARNAAKQWREQVLDPLYIMAGGDPAFLKQHYFSRIYAQGTLSDFAKAGLVGNDAAEKLLSERLLMPDDVPMPANKMAMRALMLRKLGDTEAYLSDPRLVNRLYVTQAARKVAYDPVVAKMKEVLNTKYLKGVSESGDLTRKYFNRFLEDLEGRHISYLDINVGRANKFLTKLGIPDALDASPFARFSTISTLADFIREPGYKPGARLAHVLMGLEYTRKLGWNPSSIIMNLPQHVIGTVAQGGRHVLADYAAAATGERHKALMDAFTMGGMVNDTTKFVGTRSLSERMLLGDIDKKAHPFNHALHKIYEASTVPFAKTEEWNNFMSFALAHADAERGVVFREGVGWTKGTPLSSVEANIAGFISGARRSNFGGRISRPQLMRNEGTALMFQFQNYAWRMMGKIGNEFKLSVPAYGRYKEATKKYAAAKAAGRMEEATRWGNEAGLELWRNVAAPYKTLAGLAAFASLLSAAGVDTGSAFNKVFGFAPGLDQEDAFFRNKIRITDSVSLGPAAGELRRAQEVVANVLATVSSDPSKNELALLRVAEAVAFMSPVGEVVARKFARAVLDPRLDDNARLYMLMGFQAGEVKDPADVAREHVRALRRSLPKPRKPAR